jgi:hypothetical protein
MIYRYMKIWSTSPNTREIKIKTTISYHFMTARMAATKTSVGEDVKLECLCQFMGMQNGATALENSAGIPQKVKNRISV